MSLKTRQEFRRFNVAGAAPEMRTLRSKRLRYAIWRHQQGLCAICESPVEVPLMHIDHIFPYCKGGKTSLANLQATCAACNRKKHAKVLQDIRR